MKTRGFVADGLSSVDVKCAKCRRRWFHLRGTINEGLSVPGVYFVQWQGIPGAAPNEWHDPWKAQVTTVQPQVNVDEFAGKPSQRVALRGTGYTVYTGGRYRVVCHRRCGRPPEIVTRVRLDESLREALRSGHADTTL